MLAQTIGDGGVAAITDHDVMSGIVAHQKACEKYNVKPIFGVEATIEGRYHLTLLAQTSKGLVSLYRLLGSAKTWDDLSQNSYEVICLSGDIMGPLSIPILEQDVSLFKTNFKKLHDIFKDRLYFEHIDWGLQEQEVVNKNLKRFSDKYDVPVVKTSDAHYLTPDQAEAHAVLVCDGMSRKIDYQNIGYHLPRGAYVQDLGHNPHADEVASRCNVKLELGNNKIPHFDVPEGFDTDTEYLRYLTVKGLKERGVWSKEYEERFEYEIGIIESMGFSGYFLIVWDFINYAHSRGIPVGPGRGSGAGSIVAYGLSITNIDPIQYNLLFERFLNPERVSMPDFDIDFGQHKRGEVIRYVVKKYGEEFVAQIATFSELKPRAAWKSAAKVLGLSFKESNEFSDMLPDTIASGEHTINSLFDENGNLMPNIPSEYLKIGTLMPNEIVKMARGIEGAYRSVGKHAAGILIADEKINNIVPVWNTNHPGPATTDHNDTIYVSQLDKNDAEDMGLVKFDFLGLKELDVIKYTLHLLKKQGKAVPNMDEIPKDDPRVYEMISRGDTLGMFQISSRGLSHFCKKLKPSQFNDIVAATALYRPGPKDVGMHDTYVRRKNGEEPVVYIHEDHKKVLGDTYGVIIYQEQVMAIVQLMAGYSLGQADILRRAMGKKNKSVLDAQKSIFVEKGLGRGYSEEVLEETWSQIETFSRYGFNLSHSVAYSEITYQTAWLKVNHMPEFMAAQMQVRREDVEEVSSFAEEARRFGIEVMEPDINRGNKKFTVMNDKIYVGLSSIKNMNDKTANAIEKTAPYKDLDDLFVRVHLSKGDIKALLMSGALDSLIRHDDIFQGRADVMEFSEPLMKYSKKNRGQTDLFGSASIEVYELAQKWEFRELLENEYHYLGRYRSGHPVDEFHKNAYTKIKDIEAYKPCMILGLIRNIKEHVDKNGNLMAFLDIEDDTGTFSITVFSSDYAYGKFETDRVCAFAIEPSEYEGKLGGTLNEFYER